MGRTMATTLRRVDRAASSQKLHLSARTGALSEILVPAPTPWGAVVTPIGSPQLSAPMTDPYPLQSSLTLDEVARLLGMSEDTFKRFFDSMPDFPRPILCAPSMVKTRLRWRKEEVLTWLVRQPPVQVTFSRKKRAQKDSKS